MVYDAAGVRDFLEMVFHTEDELSSVCGYATSSTPGMPVNAEVMLGKLEKTRQPLACYFGTATMALDPRQNRLLNRQANMNSLHVLVLDDIGTKVPKDKMPKDLDPTYKIETSPGNEQWGLVLEAPITQLEHAKLLIKLAYSSGYTDKGGAMPNKIVRLPCGINGKKSDKDASKETFEVKLLDMDGPYYTPQTILDALELDLEWDNLLNDPELVRRQLLHTAGASQYSPVALHGETLDGVSDPILAWLYERGQVYQENGDWFTTQCPWHHQHTDQNAKTAGYSPLGYGPHDGLRQGRHFHCFHDSCAGNHGKEFLMWVVENGGPQVPVHEEHFALASRMVYDLANDNFYDVKAGDFEIQRMNKMSKVGFTSNYGNTRYYLEIGGGKVKSRPLVDCVLENPACVKVRGFVNAPGKPLICGSGPIRQFNFFDVPPYNRRPAKMDLVVPFIKYMDYLIPNDFERKYFLDLLSCKAADPTFRGNAIVMVAQDQEGTGRGTLGKILADLWGRHNISNVAFGDVINPTYNHFMKNMFVTCDETLMDRGEKQKQAAYEHLKSLIEPSPTGITVNEKYVGQYTVYGGPTFLFFSNHADAMYVRGQARRFFVITNPKTPRLPTGEPDSSIFENVYAWKDSGKDWQTEVWNWLLDRDVDVNEMLKPAPSTDAKEIMREATGSMAEKATRAALAAWPSDLVVQDNLRDIVVNLLLKQNPNIQNAEASFNVVKNFYMAPASRKASEGIPRAWKTPTGKTVALFVKKEAADVLIYSQYWQDPAGVEKARLADIFDNNLFAMIENEAADALDLL